MAVCPKCKKKIPIYHVSQMCPHCGVNVRFYDFDKTFYRDAKRAELSNAKIGIFIVHLKATLIGSKLTIIRLCVMLLPLLSLLIPYANANISQPFVDEKVTLSALGVYLAVSGGHLNYIMEMMKGGPDAKAFSSLLMVYGGLALIAVVCLLIFILTLLSFASIKKMPTVLCVLSIIGIVFTFVTAVLSFMFVSAVKASNGIILSASVSFGYIITCIMFAVNFVINLLIKKQGYNIEYHEGDLERKAIAEKVKAGEINIDDLPQPIVETAETREIDAEIARQQNRYHDKEEEEGDGNEEN